MTATEGLIVRPFAVSVPGFSTYAYVARSRGQALSHAWASWSSIGGGSFKDFLRIARCRAAAPDPRFGEKIVICGQPAFYVGHNSQYIQFVRPGSDVILNAHPLDVEPPEARRGSPYFRLAIEMEGAQ